MTEKELVSQLNNLKEIKPVAEWKRASREILLSQISGGYQNSDKAEFIENNFFAQIKNLFAKPIFVTASILLAVFGGGIFSISAARGTKPGDSLYIAKIISEKTKFAITFNEEKKAKLGIEFAGNRAKEIAQVASDKTDEKEKTETVGRLTRDLKKEIVAVKVRLKKINSEIENNNSDKSDKEENKKDDSEIFSANLEKDNNGMQIFNPNREGGDTGEADKKVVSDLDAENSRKDNSNEIKKVLGEAEKLINEKDYSSTLNKLDEAETIASEIDKSKEEKDAEAGTDTATSTK